MLRRIGAYTKSGASTPAGSICCSTPRSVTETCTFAAMSWQQIREMHGKPTRKNRVRSQHTNNWFLKSKSRTLTALQAHELPTGPTVPNFPEDIDRPAVVPDDAACLHCGKQHTVEHPHKMVWIQSGNAAVPTKAGYFFCVECFKCNKCGFRFFNNVFHTVNGKGWCMNCVQNKPIVYPTRNWHTPMVNSFNTGSRMTGHKFPRHAHQQEFLFNPNE